MVKLRVNRDKPGHYEILGRRVYDDLPKEELESIQTQTQLIAFIQNKFFKKNGNPRGNSDLLKIIATEFEDQELWNPAKVEVPMEPVQPKPQAEQPTKVETGAPPTSAPAKKPKQIKLRLTKAATDEGISTYVASRPTKVKKNGVAYRKTKSGKWMRKSRYAQLLKNMRMGWNKKRKSV